MWTRSKLWVMACCGTCCLTSKYGFALDVEACCEIFEELAMVNEGVESSRGVVCKRRQPKVKFVQANTFVDDLENVTIKEDESDKGIIQSSEEREF